ncbi:hypothetical protein [Rodentibacter caecimuris]|uniref:hypothetical protein n=1 Tax=Rodentibacter caecimuris TaxID=1796644 RepID=UPI0012FF86E7|nr:MULTISPECIES: hypothetical protein [Pasteurellaceae]MCR1838181.1 hypothetical protein [Pasteurella caecimuris]MCU0107529.1 hypothetical protein [Pasteurella caecimuris]
MITIGDTAAYCKGIKVRLFFSPFLLSDNRRKIRMIKNIWKNNRTFGLLQGDRR